jgi:hypothetical protein
VSLKILQFGYSFLYATEILDSLGGEDGQWLNDPIIPFYFFPSFALFPPPPQKKNGLKFKHSFPQYGLGSF